MSSIQVQRARAENFLISLADESGEAIILDDDEKIIFCVKKNEGDIDYSIVKELTSDDLSESGIGYEMMLTSNDTSIPAGYYYYDLLVYTAGDYYPAEEYQPFVVVRSVFEVPEE